MSSIDRARTEQIAARVLERCDVLAECSDASSGISRGSFSLAMQRAHAHLRRWMEEAGLEVRVDAVGNIVGRRAAAGRSAAGAGTPVDRGSGNGGSTQAADGGDARTLLAGSHLDSVENAGRYDGVIGVLLGLAIVEALGDEELPFHLDVIGFSDEDGLRFGSTYFGSLGAIGRFPPAFLDLRDGNGTTLRHAMEEFGLDPDDIPSAGYSIDKLVGFIEAHIEQGPILHSQERPLGICEAVVGQGKYDITFRGSAAHAGTTPMALRRDAGVAAAQFICEVERIACSYDSIVATVGALHFRPGASNVVPAEAELSLDLRGPDDVLRAEMRDTLLGRAEEIAEQRGLEVSHNVLLDRRRQPLDREWSEALIAQTGGLRMVSGAGHDAAIMAAYTPSALLFLRNPEGISHHPDEAVVPDDIPLVVAELVGFVRELARREFEMQKSATGSSIPGER